MSTSWRCPKHYQWYKATHLHCRLLSWQPVGNAVSLSFHRAQRYHPFRYCIACVKSTVYIFELEWGEMIASFDSHFGRILVLKGLSTGSGGNNCVISTGMDKTTKVWNLENAREKSISIFQLDKAIEMMHISTETQLILAQTRTQLCLFDMRTGFIRGQLIASPHGSIYQCERERNECFDRWASSFLGTAMCSNGLFAVAAESGNFVLWDIEERKITFLTPMRGIFQLILHTAETMVRLETFIKKKPVLL